MSEPDEVNFGPSPKPTREQLERRHVLETAAEYVGDGVLTEWEEDFVRSCAERTRRLGAKWSPSEAQEAAIERIREKLEKENLL